MVFAAAGSGSGILPPGAGGQPSCVEAAAITMAELAPLVADKCASFFFVALTTRDAVLAFRMPTWPAKSHPTDRQFARAFALPINFN